MEALQQAIQRALANGDKSEAIDSALGHALRRISVEAHEEDIPAERLLIALKGVLDSIPDLQVDGILSTAESAHPLRARVVTACIRAYYGSNGSSPEARAD
jgi:hypothetical protein